MDCERFDMVSMDLLYSELDELSEAAALRHLHHCTRCRDVWGHLRTTRELSQLPQEAVPTGLFESIMDAEKEAQKGLPARERVSRVISVLAGYAMRPQLAMAALLLLMIGSSLIFVRSRPQQGEHVSIVERGAPSKGPSAKIKQEQTLIFEGEEDGAPASSAASSAAALSQGATAEAPVAPHDNTLRKTYAEAMQAYQAGRYARAERLFSEVASTRNEQSASAALHEGHAARNGSGCQRAVVLYDAVAAQYQESTASDEALWHAASCYQALGLPLQARAHYQSLAKKPAFSARAESALSEMGLSIATADANKAEIGVRAKQDTDQAAASGARPQRSAAAAASKSDAMPAARPDAEAEPAAQPIRAAPPPSAVPPLSGAKSSPDGQ